MGKGAAGKGSDAIIGKIRRYPNSGGGMSANYLRMGEV